MHWASIGMPQNGPEWDVSWGILMNREHPWRSSANVPKCSKPWCWEISSKFLCGKSSKTKRLSYFGNLKSFSTFWEARWYEADWEKHNPHKNKAQGSKRLDPGLLTHVPPLLLLVKWEGPRDFPGGLVIKSPPSNAGDVGSAPGQGTKGPQAVGQLRLNATTAESEHCNQRSPHTSTWEDRTPWQRPGRAKKTRREGAVSCFGAALVFSKTDGYLNTKYT